MFFEKWLKWRKKRKTRKSRAKAGEFFFLGRRFRFFGVESEVRRQESRLGDAAGGHEVSRQGWVTGVRLGGFFWTGRCGSGCSMRAICRVPVTVFGKGIVSHVLSIAQMIGVFEGNCEIRVKLGELCFWGMDLCVLGGRWGGSGGLVWGCGDVFRVIVGVMVAAGRSWGGSQFEADAELAEPVEGVDVVDVEVVAYVWYWDPSLDQGPVNFLGYQGQVICQGVGDKPPIRLFGKIGLWPRPLNWRLL